jgi:uncharacterized protein (DUF342 family)
MSDSTRSTDTTKDPLDDGPILGKRSGSDLPDLNPSKQKKRSYSTLQSAQKRFNFVTLSLEKKKASHAKNAKAIAETEKELEDLKTLLVTLEAKEKKKTEDKLEKEKQLYKEKLEKSKRKSAEIVALREEVRKKKAELEAKSAQAHLNLAESDEESGDNVSQEE